MKKHIPEKTVARLLLYYRYLYFLLQQGTKNISSKSLADMVEIKDSQVRKDLSYFGKLGGQGAGYDVLALRDMIAKVLDIGQITNVCIIGMGGLGSALASYKGFEALGFNVAAVFDNAAIKVGHCMRGHTCLDSKELSKVVAEKDLKVAILTVPGEAAQKTSIALEQARVKAILNFTPVKLSLSKNIKIRNIDLAMELKTLSFFVK